MGKLKALFSNVSNSIKETYKKFPITILIVYFLTLMHTFGTNYFISEFYQIVSPGIMAMCVLGIFFVENCFSERNTRIFGVILSICIAVGVRILFEAEVSFVDLLERICMTYLIVLPLLTLYKIIKKSELEIKEYALNVLSNFGKCTIIYILANLGILLVLVVFIELILDGNDWNILGKTLILLLGGYYVPALINALTDMSSKPTKFIKVLIMYVLTPIIVFLIVILYMYLAKITLNGELLNNGIFSILASTFCGVIPISILLENYDESDKVKKISKALVILFIPFIILQIIAIGIRVNEYGLTESRYMACLAVTFEVVFISLMLIKNSKYLDKSILFVVGLAIFAILSPLNVEEAPQISQAARLENLISKASSFEKLSDDEKNECKEAYEFLQRRKYVIEKIDKETLDKIENYEIVKKENSNEVYYEDYSYISVNDTIDGIDITMYSKIYELYKNYSATQNQDYTNYQITDKNGKIKTEANIQSFIDEMIKADMLGNENEVFNKNRIIETENENVKVYLTNFSMRYEVSTKNISSIRFTGYILVK